MRVLKQHFFMAIFNNMLVDLPSPSNLSYFWGFGSLLGLCLILQLGSGIFLAMHYCPNTELAFISVEHIMRDVNYGWLIRYAHANGASMFFICVFIHIGRGLYYGSYMGKRAIVWNIGIIIFILMMATAFIGYVLVFGSMSLWGCVVITNLLSAIPFVGQDIVEWIWGGYSVSNPTLNRFYSFHYLLPFILTGLIIVHLIALHIGGSNNPIGLDSNIDKLVFHPYYSIKDLFGYTIFTLLYIYLIFFDPNWLGHSDNYIPANPLVTPTHIQPEWYFLFAYAILRSIPDKLLGVLALFSSLLILFTVPIVEKSVVRSKQFKPLSKFLFWLLVGNFQILTFIGEQIVEEPFVTIGQLSSIFYFLYFLVLVRIITAIEQKITL